MRYLIEGLMALSQAGDFAKQLHDLQEQMMAIHHHPRIRWESPVVLDPSTYIDGTSWAEETDIHISSKMRTMQAAAVTGSSLS